MSSIKAVVPAIVAPVAANVGGIIAAVIALLLGILVILDGALDWGKVPMILPMPRPLFRASEIVVGLILVFVAIMILTGGF